MPRITNPKCIKGNIMLSNVDSWPPCKLAVELNTAAGLLTSAPDNQRLLVVSKKYFMGAAILPKRVGLPRAMPSQFFKSSSVTKGAPLSGILGSVASLVGETDGTVRIHASALGTDS